MDLGDCSGDEAPRQSPAQTRSQASCARPAAAPRVYPATQNLLLAARGLGLGAAMTTLHSVDEPVIREHFGIPEGVSIGATIPIGYREGRYGPLTRKPDAEVTYWDRWGAVR